MPCRKNSCASEAGRASTMRRASTWGDSVIPPSTQFTVMAMAPEQYSSRRKAWSGSGSRPVFFADEIGEKAQDELEVVVAQRVLGVGAEGGAEKDALLADKLELALVALADGAPAAHVLERLEQELVEIPVDEIVFVREVAVERLTRHPGLARNAAHRQAVDCAVAQAALRRVRKAVFDVFSLRHRASLP